MQNFTWVQTIFLLPFSLSHNTVVYGKQAPCIVAFHILAPHPSQQKLHFHARWLYLGETPQFYATRCYLPRRAQVSSACALHTTRTNYLSGHSPIKLFPPCNRQLGSQACELPYRNI